MKFLQLFLMTIAAFSHGFAQKNASNFKDEKALLIVAHPDDESMMSATIYKLTHELNVSVDEAVITDGEAGYKYSLPASVLYGKELCNESIARKSLPKIRKEEVKNAGKIIGIRKFFFLNQKDAHYCLNESEPLDTSWDIRLVEKKLSNIILKNRYSFIFCLLPVDSTHGQHKAASLLALQVLKRINSKAVIMGISTGNDSCRSNNQFIQLKNYAITKVQNGHSSFSIDRDQAFGYHNKLNYRIITEWEMAEQKSQGLLFSTPIDRYEIFWYFSLNSETTYDKASKLFDALHKSTPQF